MSESPRGAAEAVAFMRDSGLDGWLVYDFRGSNPVMRQLLPGWSGMTRRGFLLIPAGGGEPVLLVSAIEASRCAGIGGVSVVSYSSRQDLVGRLRELLAGCRRVAMEYSPKCQLPTLSWVDGGTLDLVRSLGVEVVGSADLHQAALNTWSPEALRSHRTACAAVAEVRDRAFEHIGSALDQGRNPTEFEVQQFIGRELAGRGLDTDHPAIVAANAHSGDPHYAPGPQGSQPIRRGDWVLIDLWARLPGEQNVFGDITWVAFAGREPGPRQREVFDIVRAARDCVLSRLREAHAGGRVLQGWELDRAARGMHRGRGIRRVLPAPDRTQPGAGAGGSRARGQPRRPRVPRHPQRPAGSRLHRRAGDLPARLRGAARGRRVHRPGNGTGSDDAAAGRHHPDLTARETTGWVTPST